MGKVKFGKVFKEQNLKKAGTFALMSSNPAGATVLAAGGKSNSGGFPKIKTKGLGKTIGRQFSSKGLVGRAIGKKGILNKLSGGLLGGGGSLMDNIMWLIELGIGASVVGGVAYMLLTRG